MTDWQKNLARRVGTAAVALPLLGLVIFKADSQLTVGLVMVAVILGWIEMQQMGRKQGIAPLQVAGSIALALAFCEPVFPNHMIPAGALAPILVLTGAFARAKAAMATSMTAAAFTLLGVLWIGGLGGCLAGLAVVPTPDPWRLVLLLAIVMGADVLAYFVGSAMGRHKLAPAISPGKTIEGAAGGVAGGILGALGVRALGLPGLPVEHAIALGALTAGLGMIGDLAESQLKRWAGVKDSGALFPGHGGMLDRLDSLLFGAPVLYHYFLYVR